MLRQGHISAEFFILFTIITLSFPILLTFAPIADAQTSVEIDRALLVTPYDGSAPQPQVAIQAGVVNPCGFQTAGDPSQCAWIPFASLPDWAVAAIATQGVILNPGAGNVLIISSGVALDATVSAPGATLSTAMAGNACVFNGGLNPGGFTTMDCVTLDGFHFDQTYFSMGASAEMGEFQGSTFTDQFRTAAGAGSFLTDINSWDASVNSGLWFPWGPTSIVPPDSSSTNGFTFIGANIVIDAEVADSSDQQFDSMIIFLPSAAFEDPPQTEFCGNGTVEPGEQCDDGNNNNGDGCDAQCQFEPLCGEGNIDAGEECDDGNNVNNDGCSSTCQNEFCGDGIQQSNEECDDGNTNNGDGCDSTCQSEITIGFCGDGNLDAGEECDDGNNTNNDGCDAQCNLEVVGGSVLPIDTTALLVAGAQSNALWILTTLAVIGSVAFGALYLTTRRD